MTVALQPQPAPAAPPDLNRTRLASGLALALLGAVGFSGKAIIVKLGYRHGVDAATLIMYRMLFALPIFLGMAWWAGRGRPKLTWRQWAGIVFLGFIGYYLSSYLDFLGLQYVSASLERLVLYLNPTLVALLGLVLYRRRVGMRQVLGMVISYSGIFLVFFHELTAQGPDVLLGGALVFASALAYSLYLVYSGELVQRLGALRLVGLATSVACICCIVQFLLLRPLAAAAVVPEVLWLSAINATACTAVPVLLVMMGIERIGPSLSSQVGMVGPMVTLMLGALILDEVITAWVLLGTALVLVGVYVVSRGRS